MNSEQEPKIDRKTAGFIYNDIRLIHEIDYYQYVLELAKVFERYGYRKIPELRVLSDEEIVSACGLLSINYRRVAQAQLESIKKQIEEYNG